MWVKLESIHLNLKTVETLEDLSKGGYKITTISGQTFKVKPTDDAYEIIRGYLEEKESSR